MKRLLILTGVAVLAIASCARDEIKTVNKGHAIDFKVVETKGDVKQYANDMDHFYVTAFNLTTDGQTQTGVTPFFTDAYFGRLGDYFTSNPAYYWPADGSHLGQPLPSTLKNRKYLTLHLLRTSISRLTS